MLTRRGVLGLMGGLPFTRPDQHYEPPAAGLVPGSRSGVLIAKKVVIIAGGGGGLFVYSPTAGLGNLIASITAGGGTDSYGNAYLADITSYFQTGGKFIAAQLFDGALIFSVASAAGGPYAEQGFMQQSSIAGNPLIISNQPGQNVQVQALLQAQAALSVTGGTTTDTLVASNASSASPVVSITNTTSAPSNDTLRVNPAGSADKAIGVRVTGESNDRFLVQTNATPGATLFFGPGTSGADISLLRAAANQLNLHTADLDIDSAGRGLRVAEGSNAKQGTATLAAGTVTVANTSVTANSRIFLTAQNSGAAPGALRVSARTAGTSFTITSTSGTDTSLVAWEIFEPG